MQMNSPRSWEENSDRRVAFGPRSRCSAACCREWVIILDTHQKYTVAAAIEEPASVRTQQGQVEGRTQEIGAQIEVQRKGTEGTKAKNWVVPDIRSAEIKCTMSRSSARHFGVSPAFRGHTGRIGPEQENRGRSFR